MQSKRKYIINVGVCFLLLVLPVLLLDNFEITFDAAMNFDVSKNLVKYGEYATFAFEWISVTFAVKYMGLSLALAVLLPVIDYVASRFIKGKNEK